MTTAGTGEGSGTTIYAPQYIPPDSGIAALRGAELKTLAASRGYMPLSAETRARMQTYHIPGMPHWMDITMSETDRMRTFLRRAKRSEQRKIGFVIPPKADLKQMVPAELREMWDSRMPFATNQYMHMPQAHKEYQYNHQIPLVHTRQYPPDLVEALTDIEDSAHRFYQDEVIPSIKLVHERYGRILARISPDDFRYLWELHGLCGSRIAQVEARALVGKWTLDSIQNEMGYSKRLADLLTDAITDWPWGDDETTRPALRSFYHRLKMYYSDVKGLDFIIAAVLYDRRGEPEQPPPQARTRPFRPPSPSPPVDEYLRDEISRTRREREAWPTEEQEVERIERQQWERRAEEQKQMMRGRRARKSGIYRPEPQQLQAQAETSIVASGAGQLAGQRDRDRKRRRTTLYGPQLLEGVIKGKGKGKGKGPSRPVSEFTEVTPEQYRSTQNDPSLQVRYTDPMFNPLTGVLPRRDPR